MLTTLVERESGDALPLPTALVQRYGGELRFPRRSPFVYANFVSTIDGVVSFAVPGAEHAAVVSEGHAGDRFMLALLRAVADAVIVGAGTLRKEPASVWTAESVFPEAAAEFADLRRALRRPPHPTTIIATRSGEIDRALPVFRGPARVVVAEGDRSPVELIALARRESGGERILTEGGPTVLGHFLDAGVVDELFLTIAPRIAGRDDERRRVSLVEARAFTPERAPRAEVVSVKIADDYLFTRFAIGRSRASG